ncbi:MAG: ActS/PrrB/RegB family redox-sensitive histidine kinase, partial [Caulobacteraceae bacterium]
MGRPVQKLTQAIAPADLKPRGLRLRDLIWLRWLSLGAQLAGLAAAATLADLAVPLLPALALIGLGVALNLSVLLVAPHDRPTRDLEATLQLGFDILQVSGLLFLTGGTINPFALLLIAPPTLAAAALPARNAAALALL